VAPAVSATGISGGETILLVEDDDDVRGFAVDCCATSATGARRRHRTEALPLLDQHPEVRLLFTYVALPGG
jgi:hypothetical protein